jgi:hypothetical protein
MSVRLEVVAPPVGRRDVVQQLLVQRSRDEKRHSEGYFKGIYDYGRSFALPTREERLVSRAARAAYWAFTIEHYYATQHDLAGTSALQWYLSAPCNACGCNTGNWCDNCENNNVHHYAYDSGCRVGSALCTACEDEDQCKVCNV